MADVRLAIADITAAGCGVPSSRVVLPAVLGLLLREDLAESCRDDIVRWVNTL